MGPVPFFEEVPLSSLKEILTPVEVHRKGKAVK
jgi:hypothetical protein